MHASADSLAFAPPREPAAVRAFLLAFLAHLLLAIALAWGINWQKEPTIVAEAELWSRMPEQAEPPPPPPAPQPAPPVVEKTTPPPVAKETDIVQEREKKRREEEAQRLREEEERKALEAQKKQQQEEAAKREQAEKQKKEKARQELEAKQREAQREENVRKMLAQAGNATTQTPGNSAKSAGPSATWGQRVVARVRPNIQVPGDVAGNPRAEVEVRLAPDGTIVGARLVKSSGNPAWDRAVLNALDLTGSLPRDIDGTVPSQGTLVFGRHD